MNKYPKINFIGNKEKIAKWVIDFFPKDAESVFDAFSGGGSIGYESKIKGFKVISNDVLKINFLISKSLIENKDSELTYEDVELIFSGEPFEGSCLVNIQKYIFFQMNVKHWICTEKI